MKLIQVGAEFTEEKCLEIQHALNQGERVRVYVNCIGHTRNNLTQDIFLEELSKVYKDDLEFKCNIGGHSYGYDYRLNR